MTNKRALKRLRQFSAVFISIIILSVYVKGSLQYSEGVRLTKELKQLNPEQIDKIVMTQGTYPFGNVDTLQLNSQQSKSHFAEGMKNITDYFPKKEHVRSLYDIQLHMDSGVVHEFEVWLKKGDHKYAYLHLIKHNQDGRMLKNLGSRKSAGLYKWIEKYR